LVGELGSGARRESGKEEPQNFCGRPMSQMIAEKFRDMLRTSPSTGDLD